MDAVTAVSGSGPAYVFLLIEALAAAGAKRRAAGRPGAAPRPRHGRRLRRVGAAVARKRRPRLRENVTSPGGTTRAALDVLMGDAGLSDLLDRAVAAATRAVARTGELTGPGDGEGPVLAARVRRRRRAAGRRPRPHHRRRAGADRRATAGGGCRWRRSPTEAGLPILQVYRAFPSKPAILCAFFRRIDEAVLATPVEAEADERPRDRVFDLLMRRFDALQPVSRRTRGACAANCRPIRWPRWPPAPGCCARCAWMLEAAGIATDGLGGVLAVKLTAAAYLATVAGLAARRLARSRADDGDARPAAARHRALVWRGPRSPRPAAATEG